MSPAGLPHLTIIVPGLFGPPPPAGTDVKAALEALTSGLDLSALETLLSRAWASANPEPFESPEDLLFTALGYSRPEGDWPVAAISRLADAGLKDTGFWLRADPVHLRADMGDLVLFDAGQFKLTREDADGLASEVAAHFAESGWRLEAPHPSRWYLTLDQPPQITTTPLSMAAFKSVDACLPAGADAARWHALLNETQMVLHECAVNQARETRGEAPVNSLWFWGGGPLPPVPASIWSGFHGDSALLRGFARLLGAECRPPAEDVAKWIASLTGENHLLLVEEGYAPSRASNVEAWREFAVTLSAKWFDPLIQALDRGALRQLTVLTDRKLRYHAGRARWWRQLRARRSFAMLAAG